MEEFRRYPLTYTIIVLNIIPYLVSATLCGSPVDIDLETLVDLGALYGPLVVLKGEWWRLLSAMFLHGGVTHILMNMVSLYVVGRGAELYFSKTVYIILYLLSGLIGGVVSLHMHFESVAVGASGAIFGIFGALAGFLLARRDQITSGGREIIKDFAVILGLNLLLGLSIASVDMSAHIGGLITGLIGGFVVSKNPKGLVLFIGAGAVTLAVGVALLRRYYVQIYM